MKPSELIAFLAAMFGIRQPVLIVGAPGIGKSEIVAQAAALVRYHLLISHPAVEDPTNATGLPWISNGRAVFLPIGQTDRILSATEPTVWFLDDMGQAMAATQSSYMQWLLARELNGHKLPDCVTIVAATNRRTDRAGVSGMLEPVKSRFDSIVTLEPDVDEWSQWAIDKNLPPELIAFIRFRPELLCAFTATADMTNSPVPRTWSAVARILALRLPDSIQHQAIVGAVGEGAAVELSAFLKLYAELPTVEQILIDPASVAIPSKPALLYAVAGAVAMKVTPVNFPQVGEFIQMLIDDCKGEFGALLLRDALRKCPEVAKTKTYIKLASGELGSLMSGK